MGDAFHPYREALVVEHTTIWPAELAALDAAQRAKIEAQLHADPAQAAEVAYIRVFTGFCRQITVTPADLERLKGQL